MKYWMIIGQFLLAFAVQADSLSLLSAEGFGFADAKRFPESQARLMAVRAAKIDAQRNLLETINGVRVTAGTTVKDMALESDIIGTRVKGMLQGSFEVSSDVKLESDNWVASVTMAVCLGKDDSDCKERKTLVSVTQPNLKPTEPSDRFQANDLAGWDCVMSSEELGQIRLVDENKIGLFSHTIAEGTGASPASDSTVEVAYAVSIKGSDGACQEVEKRTSEVQVNSLIEGFSVALMKMKPGGEVALHIPPQLGFKTRGPAGLGPDSNLYARLELLNIVENESSAVEQAAAPDAGGAIASVAPPLEEEGTAQSFQSGLVLDASELNFSPMLDVRVKTAGGKELYGPGHVPMGSDWLYWSASIEDANRMVDVIGDNPMVIKPVKIGEASELVVSDADAISLFTSNTVSGDYLGAGKVIIVVSGS